MNVTGHKKYFQYSIDILSCENVRFFLHDITLCINYVSVYDIVDSQYVKLTIIVQGQSDVSDLLTSR